MGREDTFDEIENNKAETGLEKIDRVTSISFENTPDKLVELQINQLDQKIKDITPKVEVTMSQEDEIKKEGGSHEELEKITQPIKEQIETVDNKIKEIGQEFSQKIEFIKNPTSRVELTTELETKLSELITKLIEDSENQKNKKILELMIWTLKYTREQVNVIRNKFKKSFGLSPTLENIKKDGVWERYGNAGALFFDNLENGEKSKLPLVKIEFDELSAKEQSKLFEVFGFGSQKQIEDIYNTYNKNKSFFSREVVSNKSHFINVPTNIDGLFLRSENFDNDEKAHIYLVMGKKYFEEIFKEKG